jgi:heme oxygenase
MIDTTPSAMHQLREATRSEHDRAESHTFQQALVRGDLSRTAYATWLGQMYLIHHSLESALREAAASHERVRNVVHEYQYQVQYLLEDLTFLGVDPATIESLSATQRFAAFVAKAKEDPLVLLGLHYVVEGSNNGSRYIARHVARAYDLEPGPGLRYLDPYGDQQREYWTAFKNDMGSESFTDNETGRLIEAAKQMYRTVADLSDDLADLS